MASASGSGTSVSLLCELGEDPTDQAVWNHFVERYSPQIHGWCRLRCFSLETPFGARDDLLTLSRLNGATGAATMARPSTTTPLGMVRYAQGASVYA